MKYSIDWLKEQIKNEITVDYLFFWGHTPQKNQLVDKSCLSQWFPSSFVVENVTYLTAEHWMMAQKAKLFNDTTALHQILEAQKPAIAKALGRTVKNFDKATWDAHAYNFVVEGNIHKFSQNESLGSFLVKTGKKVIVEASPVDSIWGIGLSQEAKGLFLPSTWRGTNWLGFALMEVRDVLLKMIV